VSDVQRETLNVISCNRI